MDIRDSIVIVTGGGHGIGKALCERCHTDGAAGVLVADIDFPAAQAVAESVDGIAVRCNVSDEGDVARLVAAAVEKYGRIDIFVSNAGITTKGGVDVSNDDWQRLWDVNVMSRIYAARAVLPEMLKRGRGYLVQVASAAALVTEIGSAAYSVTKQADLALAEWLAVQHGREGVAVSCVCPLGVETDMLDRDDPVHQFLQVQSISADEAAATIAEGIRDERFLILPHPQVAEFFQMKSADHDRWVRGMQRLKQKLTRKKAA